MKITPVKTHSCACKHWSKGPKVHPCYIFVYFLFWFMFDKSYYALESLWRLVVFNFVHYWTCVVFLCSVFLACSICFSVSIIFYVFLVQIHKIKRFEIQHLPMNMDCGRPHTHTYIHVPSGPPGHEESKVWHLESSCPKLFSSPVWPKFSLSGPKAFLHPHSTPHHYYPLT